MISIDGLKKSFGETVAVDGISLEASPGCITGLLGPNGAGKSTTISCISGLLQPSAGRIRVAGHDVLTEEKAAKSCLGVVPQELALYEELSAHENLSFWGAAHGMRGKGLEDRVQEVLETVQLEGRAKEAVKNFSGGMKRRLNFACGVVHHPQVLLLDEPTVGVDPQSRVRLLDLVRKERERGVTVLYTTHYMEEAEALCDRLHIMDEGRIIAEGTMPELREQVGGRELLRLTGDFDADRLRQVFAADSGSELLSVTSDMLLLSSTGASEQLPALFARVQGAGGRIQGTTLTQPSLESLFIKLTGKELRE